jgi:Na+/proline symporter
MNALLLAILAYVASQIAIGIWYSRRIATESDYILAGRALGPGLVAFSVFATFFGSEAVTASAAAIYDKGLGGAIVDPLAYAAAIVIVGLFFAARLRAKELTTFADLFRNRFSPGVEKLVVVVLLPGSLFWAAAQIRVFGVVLESNSSIGLANALLIAAVAVGVFSVIGGLMADSVTDTIQGCVVIAGLLILAVAVATVAGGPITAISSAAANGRVSLFGDDTVLTLLEKIAIPVCGTIVAVELISRFLGARNPEIAGRGTTGGGLIYLLVGLVPIYLGLIGPTVMPDLKETEELVPRLAQAFLPGLLYAVFVGAIISAILSTVHSTLHAPAAQVSHNVVSRLLPDLTPQARLWSVRLTVAVLTVVAYLLAVNSNSIKELVETASAFGSAGVFVTLMFALFTNFGGAASAYGAIVGGIVVWAGARYGLNVATPYLMALVASAAVYVTLGFVVRDASARSAG